MVSPHAVAYTVEVVDKTGKAIHTSRTLFSAIREAREAYKAKKAQKKEERLRRAYEEQERLRARRQSQQRQARELRTIEEGRRGSTGSSLELRERERKHARSKDDSSSSSSSKDKNDKSLVKRMHSDKRSTKGLVRRATADDAALMLHSNVSTMTLTPTEGTRSAPGSPELSPTMLATPSNAVEVPPIDDHLTALLTQCNDIFDSLSALQFSVTTLIGALQRDPESLAVVGLTLAEISSIITKLSPGVLAGLKASWPMVFAFLSSPQFAIMAGVGIGTTVVLIGGYKIVKKLMGGETKPDPVPVDMGGRVVGEVEVREIAAPPPPPPPAFIEEIPPMELTPPPSPPRERRKSKDDGLAFGSSSKKSSSSKKHKDDGLAFGGSSPTSPTGKYISDMAFGHDERASPSKRKSSSPPASSSRNNNSPPTPLPTPPLTKVVPDLQFDIPKKHKSKSGKGFSSSSSEKDKKTRSEKSTSSRKTEKERHR